MSYPTEMADVPDHSSTCNEIHFWFVTIINTLLDSMDEDSDEDHKNWRIDACRKQLEVNS